MRRRITFIAALAAALALVTGLPAAPVSATPPPAPAGWQTVTRAGIAVSVPGDWEVVDLAADPTRCLRLDVPAVYLGRPGADAVCPSRAVGRVTTVQLLTGAEARAERASGAPQTAADPDPVATDVTAPDGRLVRVRYAANGDVERQVAASVAFAAGPTVDAAPTPTAPPADEPVTSARSSSLATRSAATTQEGFDTCAAPTGSTMATWASASPYSAFAVYIGGINRGCEQPNLTRSWVATQLEAGWSLIPTYVGRQAPCTSAGWAKISASQAASQGTAAAQDAIAQAKALGMGTATPIYLDMEDFNVQSTSCTNAVLAYFSAWTKELHRQRYVSGVYGSASSSIYAMGKVYSSTSFTRPDDVWIARWDGVRGDAEKFLTASQWAGHRIKQYRGGHSESYGGVRITIDSSYVNGAVLRRAAGATTPTNLLANPSWEAADDVTSWTPATEDPAQLATATAAGAHAGSRWAQVTAPTGGGRSISQDVDLPTHVGERWTLLAWVRSASGDPVTGELSLTGLGDAPATAATPFTAGPTWTAVAVTFDPYVAFSGVRAAVAVTTPDLVLDVDDAGLVRSPGFAPFTSWDTFVAQQASDFTGTVGSLSKRATAARDLAFGAVTPTAYIQRQIRGAWFEPHIAPVARLYWAYFGRIPDAGGVRFWAAHHRSGTRLTAISQGFATSNEFKTKTGSLTDRAFVQRIYTDVLDRTPDRSGLDYWTGQLTSKHRSRGEVMVQFSESTEYQRTMAPEVTTFLVHLGLLQKAPTQAELDLGVTQPTHVIIDRLRHGSAYAARVR